MPMYLAHFSAAAKSGEPFRPIQKDLEKIKYDYHFCFHGVLFQKSKGGVRSEGIFNLVPYLKNQTKSLSPPLFQPRVKSGGTEIWFTFLRMRPNWKYILILPHLYTHLSASLFPNFLYSRHAILAINEESRPPDNKRPKGTSANK